MGFAIVALYLAILIRFLPGTASTVHLALPFLASDVESVEMFRWIQPSDAEKKLITEKTDIQEIADTLESISLTEQKTAPAAGGAVTSFRFHHSDGSVYEVVYSSLAVKSGRIKTTQSETDYFTSADLGALWNNLDAEIMEASEEELPALY